MNRISEILIPFDFSDASINALKYTAQLVKKSPNSDVSLLHISTAEKKSAMPQQIEEKLQLAIQQHQPNFKNPLKYVISNGNLTEVIIEQKKARNIDLIIMGTKGGAKEDALTNTAKLVAEANCPVLAIPENFTAFSLNTIALTLGKQKIDDANKLEILFDVARAFSAPVHVLTISKGSESYEEADQSNESTLEYYLESLYSHHAFPQSTDIEQGILNYVDEKAIDMLVIQPNSHAKNQEPSEGRLTKLLTLHSKVPVLAID